MYKAKYRKYPHVSIDDMLGRTNVISEYLRTLTFILDTHRHINDGYTKRVNCGNKLMADLIQFNCGAVQEDYYVFRIDKYV